MTRDSHVVFIKDTAAGQLVEANLYDGISEENLRAYKEEWQPLLRAARQFYIDLRKRGHNPPPVVEDAHWDWEHKVFLKQGSLSYRHFALECNEKTEGMMQLELSMHRSRLEPGRHLVYVSYISVAPWSRKALTATPRYRGVGSILLAQAIGTSLEEGFHGRIGLHSLPGAADWYRGYKMTSFGKDPNYENLESFEMSANAATEFMQRLNK